MLKTPVIRACCNDRHPRMLFLRHPGMHLLLHPRMHLLRHPRRLLSGALLSRVSESVEYGFNHVALPIKKAVLMKTAFWISYSVKSD